MAMLAEPKRKQKFSFDPRNTSWSNDESKFGHKLMEKMGWSKGKGLGANEDGKTDNISVTVKNDTRGVGCSKSHVDNWIAHQDDFNSLLSDLQQDHGGGEDKQESANKKVISLEQKSRTSKGRLHYQKFTKGKDLSLKSETDLDCVFGKRKSQSGTSTPQPQSESSSDNEDQSHGFNTVTSTDSVQDYFKRKMAERMNKLSGKVDAATDKDNLDKSSSTEGNTEPNDITVIERDCDLMKTKSKKKSKKRKANLCKVDDNVEKLDSSTEEVVKVGEEEVDTVKEVKKKKKSKKRKQNECETESNNDVNDTNTDAQNEKAESENVPSKKPEKKKRNTDLTNSMENVSEEIRMDETDLNKQIVEDQEHVSDNIPKKKKNKKRKREEVDSEDILPKKKVTFAIGDDDENNDENNLEDLKHEKVNKREKRKAKKKVTFAIGDDDEDDNENEPEDVKPQKDAPTEEGRVPDCTNQQEIKVVTLSESLCEIVKSRENKNSVCIHNGDKLVKNEPQPSIKSQERLGFNKSAYNRTSAAELEVKEVKVIHESFSGSNMQHLQGYAGLRVTSKDVETKLWKQNMNSLQSRAGPRIISKLLDVEKKQNMSKKLPKWNRGFKGSTKRK